MSTPTKPLATAVPPAHVGLPEALLATDVAANNQVPSQRMFAGIEGLGLLNKITPPANDIGRKPLVFFNSLVPTTGPVGGGGVMHDNYARVLARSGVDVVVLAADNNLGNLDTPYHQWRLLFRPDDVYSAAHYAGFPQFEPAMDIDWPSFTGGYPSSKMSFSQMTEAEKGRYVFSWQWAWRASTLVYGVPDVVWNGHAWVMNAVTAPVVPTLFTVHGTCTNPNLGLAIKEFRKINVEGARTALKALVISEQERGKIQDEPYFLPNANVAFAPNGYRDDNFHPGVDADRGRLLDELTGPNGVLKNDPTVRDRLKVDDKWVVFVGKNAFFKGHDILIHALVDARNRMGNGTGLGGRLRLIVAGGGYDKTEVPVDDPFHEFTTNKMDPVNIRKLVSEYELDDIVFFTGPLEQPLVARVIKASDAYVLPSRKEPFGLVAPEGMATGTPPILSNGGGFKEIVANYSGDPSEIARMVTPDNPWSISNLRAVRAMLESRLSEDNPTAEFRKTQAIRALALLSQAALDESKNEFRFPESFKPANQGLNDDDRKIFEYLLNLLRETSFQATVKGLASAIESEILEDPQLRKERGNKAAQFAYQTYNTANIVQTYNTPYLREAAMRGRTANFDLVFDPQPISRQREVMLSELSKEVDRRSQRAFTHLESLVGRTDANDHAIGQAWRTFYQAVSRAIGTRLYFPNAFDPETYNFGDPNAIFYVVAALCGVSESQVFAVMQRINAISARDLLGPKRPWPMQ